MNKIFKTIYYFYLTILLVNQLEKLEAAGPDRIIFHTFFSKKQQQTNKLCLKCILSYMFMFFQLFWRIP